MNEDLKNEVEAINAIYGDESLVVTENQDVYILNLPNQTTSLRLQFPLEYPAAPLAVLGTESSGEHMRKGEAAHVADVFREVLGNIYQPGEVCLFDVIEEANNRYDSAIEPAIEDEGHDEGGSVEEMETHVVNKNTMNQTIDTPPKWTLSDAVTELKSVFIARCAPVSSPDQANEYLQHLLDSDKKVRSATHNISAWRIKGQNGVTFQDCGDDGETAAGGRVLHLMQLMDIWNVMVIVTRWYGGHQLGPKRFSIINTVAREAFVRGNFVKEVASTEKKGKN